jgi:hypothetical protein
LKAYKPAALSRKPGDGLQQTRAAMATVPSSQKYMLPENLLLRTCPFDNMRIILSLVATLKNRCVLDKFYRYGISPK